MRISLSQAVVAMFVCGVFVLLPTRALNAGKSETQMGHKKLSGIVVMKAGAPAIRTTDGASYQLSDKQAREHGHAPFKEGDEVVLVVDENNAVIDVHLKGEEGKHRFVTGKLIHSGKMKEEIKLQTDDGEKVFPLLHQETKTKPLPEGTPVTVEINEAGAVIDLHRAENVGKNK